MDNLRRLKQIENIPWNRHYLRDRSNPLEYLEDHEFQAIFRFLEDTVRSIFDLISDNLKNIYWQGVQQSSNAAAVSKFTIFAPGSF